MILPPDVVVGGKRLFVQQRELFVQSMFQDIFDQGIVDPATLQGAAASRLQSVPAILLLQHQHAKAGLVVLLDINAVAQH